MRLCNAGVRVIHKLLCDARRMNLGLRKIFSLNTEDEDPNRYAEYLTICTNHIYNPRRLIKAALNI